MRVLLKLLNPFIGLYNFLNYTSHLESYRGSSEYKGYDFSKDVKYF